MIDEFVEEIEVLIRKWKVLEVDNKKVKWKIDEIEMFIDELEKRSCLCDILDKEYYNCEKKRDVVYLELENIFK